MSAPSYASVAKEDERVASVETVEADNTQQAEQAVDKKEDAESASSSSSVLTPAPPPKVNAWNIKAESAAVVAPPSFDNETKRESCSPPAAKVKMGKPEKWLPYTPNLVMNNGGNKRSGRKGGNAAQANGASGNGSSQNNRRKSKPRAPHGGEKKDASESSATSGSANSAASSSNTSPSTNESDGSSAGSGASSSDKRKPRFNNNYRKNYYKPDFAAQQAGAPAYYAPPGAYEYALSLIIAQIEYYFSVENLCKDLFMRKQMNSQGLVPLTLIAGFNRVKTLAQDPAVFMQACKFAPSLEVVGDRIRLAQGWEQWVLPLEEREEAGKQEDVDPNAEAFPGVDLSMTMAPPAHHHPRQQHHHHQNHHQNHHQQQQQQSQSEPAKISFDVANATPFVPKKQ